MKNKGFEIVFNKQTKSADIWIYEDIGEGWFGGLSAKRFSDEMKDIGEVDNINVFINSPGGDVFDGVAIYSILRRNKANVVVEIDGLAASIASVIAMAGDEIRMGENAMMMIHNPWTFAIGNEEDLRKAADDIAKIKNASILPAYIRRTGMKEDELSNMMDEETWMGAEEAKEFGFVDEITAEKKVAAHFDLEKYRFKNMPKKDNEKIDDQPNNAETPSIDAWNRRIATR